MRAVKNNKLSSRRVERGISNTAGGRFLCISAACALLFLSSCNVQRITVFNPSDFARPEAMAEVPAKLGNMVFDADGTEIPSQVTYDGKLIFQPRLNAGESRRFTVRRGKPAKYEQRTFGRAYPERYDDFAWENDRVAFRIYGPALKPIDGPSNGIDAWYKRTDKLILDKWYADDLAGRGSYHNDHGEGLDDYKVGHTLGAGAMAPIVGDSLVLGENYERAELLESGPLRTTFKLWYAGGETRTISLDAGSQLTKIVQEYAPESAPDSVAAGFPTRPGRIIFSRFIFSSHPDRGTLIIEEPDTPLAQDVWLGLIMYGDVLPESVSDHSVISIPYTGPVTYYTGYGWGKAGMTREDFVEYMERFARELDMPLLIPEISVSEKTGRNIKQN